MDSIKAERKLSLKETRKRIERMSTQDIIDMPHHYLLRLTHDFSDEGILRLIVSRGENKEEKDYILTSLNQTYEWWLRGFDGNDAEFYFGILGYPTDKMPHYDDIDFDIATNTPLLPDEESPLPASTEGEELAAELQSRIAELEKENEALKEQVELCKNKEKGIALGLNQAQAALLGLSLANTFEFKYTNKKKQLAPLLHKLFGWGQTKLETCLSTPCEKEERDELANLFKELCPPLYATIMNWGELPQ